MRDIPDIEMQATRKYPIRCRTRAGRDRAYMGNRVVVVAAGPRLDDPIITTYRSPSMRCWRYTSLFDTVLPFTVLPTPLLFTTYPFNTVLLFCRWLDDAHIEPYGGLARPLQPGSVASASELALLSTFGDGVAYLRVDSQRGTLSFGYGVTSKLRSLLTSSSHVVDDMEPSSSYRPPTDEVLLEEDQDAAFTYDLVDANIKLQPSSAGGIGVTTEVGSAQLKIPRQPSRDLPGRFLEWEQHGQQAACLVEMRDNEQNGGEALDRVLQELQTLADKFSGMYSSRSRSRMPCSD